MSGIGDGSASTSEGGRHEEIGATVTAFGTRFRVWAPDRQRVVVSVDGKGDHALAPSGDGYHAGDAPDVRAGDRYGFRLDDEERLYPDPASRFQPEGVHGLSEVVDPQGFAWSDTGWPGVGIAGQVVYELHVGTFTDAGTWDAAIGKLDHLAELGVTVLEIMPVAEFPGRFGWGYDGVDLFAPTRLYGRPDDFRRFVDRAHASGIAVILDVVYNHLGPDGNYLSCFSKSYFSCEHTTEWGEALNFDGEGCRPVRDFYVANAARWIREYHLDGLRLDATQSIFDNGPAHILEEIVAAARLAAGGRRIIIVGENEPQETRLARPRGQGGVGLDALWNDDFHHSAMVAISGRAEAYYEDHAGAPQEFISAAKYGYLFQGQFYAHQQKTRGTPGLDLPAEALVVFTQNHDQVANSDSGLRFHALGHPGQVRAMTALLLLMPGTPMLFQGQEFAASTPFFYFADHGVELAHLVRGGRVEFMRQFPSVDADRALRENLPDPADENTFLSSRLRWDDLGEAGHRRAFQQHKDLIRLRRTDPAIGAPEGGIDGAVLGPEAFCLRYFGGPSGDRLLIVNLGPDLVRRSLPEPLLAPPERGTWTIIWSSESSLYGGHGTPLVENASGWRIPAHCALVLSTANS